MNKTKFIHITYGAGRNRDEKRLFGQAISDRETAEVYINVHKNRKSQDLIDTFFHEMAHVFFSFHGKSKQMSSTKEEKLAQQVGRICAGVLR